VAEQIIFMNSKKVQISTVQKTASLGFNLC